MLLALVLGLALAACSGAGDGQPDGAWPYDAAWRPSETWDPGPGNPGGCSYGYGQDCPAPAVDCALDPCVHGQCIESQGGSDSCLCETGYAGLVCDACAAGYVAEGLRCVPSTRCADSPCVYGTCRDAGDGFWCDCFEGYAGELCDACAAGYHAEDLECVPD
ncbi:MAG: hypothetical protein JXR96_15965 [Deltaproteobacteria bacterium]|nr:hypothetical protein [Deltaproteobacteria bacterium]